MILLRPLNTRRKSLDVLQANDTRALLFEGRAGFGFGVRTDPGHGADCSGGRSSRPRSGCCAAEGRSPRRRRP